MAALFWDPKLADFEPERSPDYSIVRMLKFGDRRAYAWLTALFPAAEIARVIRSVRRLSRRSAGFWALVYSIPAGEVTALKETA